MGTKKSIKQAMFEHMYIPLSHWSPLNPRAHWQVYEEQSISTSTPIHAGVGITHINC